MGGQTVRYGLVEDGDKKVKFRLDVDRYIDSPVIPPSSLTFSVRSPMTYLRCSSRQWGPI
jgi:hypothetical protein